MSEEVKTEEEPSIEEILDSIRQIISEDEDAEAEDAVESVDDGLTEEEQPDSEASQEPEAEPESESEPMDQSAIDDMDFDSPMPEAEVEEPQPAEEGDVLELTELVNSDENNIDIDMIETDEDSELTPEAEPLPEPEQISEPEPLPEPEPVYVPESEDDDGDSLLTGAAETAALSAISNLVRKTAVGSSSLTLEDIVRAELKPLLRSWLDKHLPIVIERLVKEELERVSKRVLDE